jgi:RNA polymerase sigma-70 factor, ECF subfamily
MTCHVRIPLTECSAVAVSKSLPLALRDLERDAMVRSIPTLKNFAKSLTHNADEADDLVQEALLRGVEKIGSFQAGTNMEAWLVTILRNLFLTRCRRRRHETAYKASLRTQRSSAHPHQYSAIQLGELQKSLATVPASYREALLLVFAYGYSYDEAAAMCGCPPGTIKSRVNRARLRLSKQMHVDDVDEFGPAERDLAVIGGSGLSQQQYN